MPGDHAIPSPETIFSMGDNTSLSDAAKAGGTPTACFRVMSSNHDVYH